MADEVIAEVEIDGRQLPHYNDIFLQQYFNQHHEFSIRINHDVLEVFGSFTLHNSKNLIGKSAVIRFFQVLSLARQMAYEFEGIITEVAMVQSHSASGDLLIKGFSPTILLEDGPRLASFNDNSLKDIVTQTIQGGLSRANCLDHIDPNYTSLIKYVSQYKESSFHFINRLSSVYGELFYYDGRTLIFGQQPTMDFVEVIYGEDMNDMQLNLHVEPIEVWQYAYTSANNAFVTSRGDDLTGLDEYADHVVQVSNTLYPDLDDIPLFQRVQNQDEVTNLVNKRKEAIAAGLVVLKGSTNNPGIFIGCVADVKISRRSGIDFIREDYGTYLVTGITHHITGTGKYYNSFEALSGWVKGIPVYNIKNPVAEPQPGWVVDNQDPDNHGRVRVQLLWQKDNEKTDWIWVMMPDAGNGRNGAPGSGMVFMPEIGDRVLVGFVYNNPDRPFVMGSLFHGRSARGPSPKCLSGRSGARVCIDDAAGSVTIEDKDKNRILVNGSGEIEIKSSEVIRFTCVDSSIELRKDGTITIKGKDIFLQGQKNINVTADEENITLDAAAKDIIFHATNNVRSTADNGDISLDAAANVVASSGAGIKLSANSEFTAEALAGKATVSGLSLSLKGTALAELTAALIKIN